MPKTYDEQTAIREVLSWGLGVEFSKLTKIITIPKDAVIGLKRLGIFDFLRKQNWLVIRLQS